MIFNLNYSMYSTSPENENLIDFKYIVKNGVYVLTDWKGTLNGYPSTEILIPEDSSIVL